ncbi:hypothetical protein K469DRAFT_649654 [Zopfia rhizophila CBS 207.26]|uniref:Uncharacterized protein n=1 Tax=Zopfia rhizophila CBS 207.26 TaxID=1314779 RepID=A0A6A6EXR4_9PEZI|nr:hypothetical protein K469DRAFT_649654 [Zopfia rhizophila CBS 207.26]
MESSDEEYDQSPKFTFGDDAGRTWIGKKAERSKFRPFDKVYFTSPGTDIREGPYIVESVPETGKYTLMVKPGQTAKDGKIVEEQNLAQA